MLLSLLALTDPAHARNYLVIIADDLGVDKVTSYATDYPGYAPSWRPRTTAIDSLATAGLRFTRTWANPLCTPTRASIHTGRHAVDHGLGYPLGLLEEGLDPAQHDLLGWTFLNEGYRTGYFGKWHVGSEDETGATGYPLVTPYFADPHPARSGFQTFDGAYEGLVSDYHDWERVTWALFSGTFIGSETDHPTFVTAQAATDWIAAQGANPWLAFVSFHAPHADNTAPWSTDDVDVGCYRTSRLACLHGGTPCADVQKAVYQGMVECLDLELADLLDDIPDAVMDDTLVIFLGDNGTPASVQEDDFAQGRGKGTVYENGLRVPFIVADGLTWRTGAVGDILKPGRRVTAEVETIDVYETLHDELGLVSSSPHSTSFTDCFTNTGSTCGWAAGTGYSETYIDGSMGHAAVRLGHHKMIIDYDDVNDCLVDTYYQTSTDPFELTPTTLSTQAVLQAQFAAMHPDATDWANGVPYCP